VVRTRRTAALLRTLVPRGFRIRYRGSALDLLWSLITPLVLLAVYGVILTQAFDADGGCAPYLSSAWTGLVVWTFFSAGVGAACLSLLGSSDLLSKVYFPREAIPLAEVGVSLIDLGIGLVTLLIVVLIQGVVLSPTAIEAIPALVVLVVWTAGLSVLAATLSVFLRDVGHAVNLLLRAGFFATPVMYETSFLPHDLRWIAAVNPVAVAIDGVRSPVLCGASPDWSLLGIQLVAGCVVLVGSVLYVRRVEDRLVDVL
jgi:lipopolysaccharide transport system permease protein